jgi:transcriptional regulator with XRE-family HTH domain
MADIRFGGSRPAGPLKQLREARGLTQAELARRAGLSPITVRRLEDGTGDLLPMTAERLARVLGVKAEDLIDPATRR